MASPAGSRWSRKDSTEADAEASSLGSVFAFSGPATEHPTRSAGTSTRVVPGRTTCVGAVTGPCDVVGTRPNGTPSRQGSHQPRRSVHGHPGIVGVDLGIATAHTVVVCDETGATLTRRRARRRRRRETSRGGDGTDRRRTATGGGVLRATRPRRPPRVVRQV